VAGLALRFRQLEVTVDDAGGPSDGSGGDLRQLDRLLVRVNRLVLRYQQREALRPDAEIAGGSRSLLINLLNAALEWLPTGPVRSSVTEFLADRDVQSPPRLVSDLETQLADPGAPAPDPLMLANELDLLDAVLQELEAEREERFGNDSPEGQFGPDSANQGGNYPPSTWDEGPSGPSTPQNRRRHDHRSSPTRSDMRVSRTVSTFF
jgi:hypothetical protein